VPEVKPAVPEVKPAVPEVKPAVPEAKPAVPEAKPAVPEAKPEAKPAVKPAVKPAAKDDPFAQRDTDSLRLWTDASGMYQIRARLVSFNNGTVRLQKANDRYVRIAFDQLSGADQDFVRQQAETIALDL
jgi:hypothetical protein